MNIFALDIDPKKAAKNHNNKHVVKMILETAQILSHNFSNAGVRQEWMYKEFTTWHQHPSVKWARQSVANMEWAITLGEELCVEYTHRYKKQHKCEPMFAKFRGLLPQLSKAIKGTNLTPFLLAMNEMFDDGLAYEPTMNELKHLDTKEMAKFLGTMDNEFVYPIIMYRRYYNTKKLHMGQWKNRTAPVWFNK